jgi:hypothetical protein
MPFRFVGYDQIPIGDAGSTSLSSHEQNRQSSSGCPRSTCQRSAARIYKTHPNRRKGDEWVWCLTYPAVKGLRKHGRLRRALPRQHLDRVGVRHDGRGDVDAVLPDLD